VARALSDVKHVLAKKPVDMTKGARHAPLRNEPFIDADEQPNATLVRRRGAIGLAETGVPISPEMVQQLARVGSHVPGLPEGFFVH
jgi:hypothetical protein